MYTCQVKLSFLPVGHTHEDVDQMFSCFSPKLAKADIFSIEQLMEILRGAYKTKDGEVVETVSDIGQVGVV